MQNTSGASISTLRPNTLVTDAFHSGCETTQVEIYQSEQKDINSDIVVSDSDNPHRHITVTKTVMQKFLDKIGTDHFRKYHLGLSLTDKS